MLPPGGNHVASLMAGCDLPSLIDGVNVDN